jgi:hypothetical protein
MAQEMIERDCAPWIVRPLPCHDRHRLVQLQRALAHNDARERRHHRLGGGEAEQRRVDADAVGIALGDDAAVLHHHDGAGVARRCPVRLGEGTVERGGELRRVRRHQRSAGDLRRQRLHVGLWQRDVDDGAAVIEIAAQPFTAIHGAALADPEQRHRDILARMVDAIVERPGNQADARHRRRRLGEHAGGIEAGDEGLGANDVGDVSGRDLRHVAGTRGRQRQRAEHGRGGEDEEQLLAGHDGLRRGYGPMSPMPGARARLIRKTASPNPDNASPIPKSS